MVVDNLSCCDHRTWGSFLALEHQFSVCLSCFLSWSISCRPSAVTSPHSLSASTTRCFVQLDQSPTSCVLGFHLPHLAAPSLPVASSSLLVIFISFSRCSFYFNRSLFSNPCYWMLYKTCLGHWLCFTTVDSLPESTVASLQMHLCHWCPPSYEQQ